MAFTKCPKCGSEMSASSWQALCPACTAAQKQAKTKGLSTLITILLLGAAWIWWANSEPSQPRQLSEQERNELYIDRQQDRLRQHLKDQSSAQFRNAYVSNKSGAPVVCGEVNAKNSFGGYSGFERFISADPVLITLESNIGRAEMNKLWARVC